MVKQHMNTHETLDFIGFIKENQFLPSWVQIPPLRPIPLTSTSPLWYNAFIHF